MVSFCFAVLKVWPYFNYFTFKRSKINDDVHVTHTVHGVKYAIDFLWDIPYLKKWTLYIIVLTNQTSRIINKIHALMIL